tara:strand:- start:227 stop:856 length:630 start_codon:yes stop_codon:yes gene_type:complete
MTKIFKTTVFTEDFYSFVIPDFENIQKQIKQIVLVEDNKKIHGVDTSADTTIDDNKKRQNRTGWNSHQRYPALNNVCKIISHKIRDFVNEEGYDVPGLLVDDCWINWYGKGHNSFPHHHSAHISAVLFVDVETSNASFCFHGNRNLVLHKKTDQNVNYSNIVSLKATNGTVIFFDGHLLHSVTPNMTDNTRITVAINYSVDYRRTANEY